MTQIKYRAAQTHRYPRGELVLMIKDAEARGHIKHDTVLRMKKLLADKRDSFLWLSIGAYDALSNLSK